MELQEHNKKLQEDNKGKGVRKLNSDIKAYQDEIDTKNQKALLNKGLWIHLSIA